MMNKRTGAEITTSWGIGDAYTTISLRRSICSKIQDTSPMSVQAIPVTREGAFVAIGFFGWVVAYFWFRLMWMGSPFD
jgi:hypothetical protein